MVIYLLASSGLCGGVRVIFSHVAGLAARGFPAEVWSPSPPPRWFNRPLPYRQFPSLDAMGAALRATRADKAATWWRTASWAAETVRESDRGFYLVQDDERHYAQWAAEENEILRTYALGLMPVVSNDWTGSFCKSLGLTPHKVGIGIDHDVFRPLPMLRDRNRVFLPHRPHMGPHDLKGWGAARAALAELRKLNPAASAVTFGNGPAPRDLPPGMAHVHLGNPSDAKLRELYCQAGVFLMTSRHEGFCLTALEAMACECPVVCTYAGGNEEYCRDGENCLMGRSAAELAAAVHRLRAGHDLADSLGRAGRETALRYTWSPVIDRLIEVYSRA